MTSLIDNTEYDKLLWMESCILNVSQTEFSRPKTLKYFMCETYIVYPKGIIVVEEKTKQCSGRSLVCGNE